MAANSRKGWKQTFGGPGHPPEVIAREFHMMTANQVPWLKTNDGFPYHDRFPPEGKTATEVFSGIPFRGTSALMLG
jgi:hypothetical protein